MNDHLTLSNPLVPRSNRGGRASNQDNSAESSGVAPSTASTESAPATATGTAEAQGATVHDLEDYRSRLMAQAGPLRLAGVELSLDGSRVVLTLPSGHVEELRGVVAIRMGQLMVDLGEWAKDVEADEQDGGLFR